MDVKLTGSKIAELRKQKQLTQKELATQLHVSDSAVSKWERGLNFPDMELLEPLAAILDTTVPELLGLQNATEQEITQTYAILSAKEKRQFLNKLAESTLFLASLIPMAFSQYGMFKGVQEVSGLINLTHPIGLISFFFFFLGVWYPFQKEKLKRWLPYLGMGGMILSELVNLLTWNHVSSGLLENITDCFEMIFPMWYIGVASSISALIIYSIWIKKIRKEAP